MRCARCDVRWVRKAWRAVAKEADVGIYFPLVFLIIGLMALLWGNDSRRRHKGFAMGFACVVLAALVMMASAIRSLWLHPIP